MGSSKDSREILRRAEKLVEDTKKVMKILYQLSFIATSDNPNRLEAMELIQQMIEMGLVSEEEAHKAMMDVKRWRDLVLDKIGRRSMVD